MCNISPDKWVGMGVVNYDFAEGKRAYGHNGTIDTFNTELAYCPEDSLAIAYCSNGAMYPIRDLLRTVVNIYYNRPAAIPSFAPIALPSADLDKFEGTYSSDRFYLKITITKRQDTLIASATGQSPLRLELIADNWFSYKPAGIILVFDPSKHEMRLVRQGDNIVFKKEY
jgi:hypothetical protein